LIIVLEGRDAAGNDGKIKALSKRVGSRVFALLVVREER
jgi:polyphosphate kinase 2 (PPK2 family)